MPYRDGRNRPTAQLNSWNGVKKCLFLAAAMAAVLNAYADCRVSTAALDSMAAAELTLSGPDDRSLNLGVRVADDDRERASGFQYICRATIDKTAIYFVFDHARRPSFHMHNVEAALDIAFIDVHGLIIDIQRMEPYVLGATRYQYYSPPGPVTAALETRAGYFAEQGITAGAWTIEALHQ